MRSTKTGACETPLTKLFFIFDADSPPIFVEESIFKDDQIRSNTELDEIV